MCFHLYLFIYLFYSIVVLLIVSKLPNLAILQQKKCSWDRLATPSNTKLDLFASNHKIFYLIPRSKKSGVFMLLMPTQVDEMLNFL
jgi:hypothetical protein